MAPTPKISGVHFKRGSDIIFTNCCIVAIKDTEEVCPSCGSYVIGGGCGYTPEKIRKIRRLYAELYKADNRDRWWRLEPRNIIKAPR
jgi:hypothetical protein